MPGTVRVRRGIDIDAGCGQLADEASKAEVERKVERRHRAERETAEAQAEIADAAEDPAHAVYE